MSVLISLASGAPVINCELSDEAPAIISGGARWDNVDRPRKLSFTHFSGVDPYEQTVKVLLDRWPDGDVEAEIRLLEDRLQLTGGATPDVLRLAGDGVKHPELTWVLTSIDWGEKTQHRPDGRRSRAEMTLTFRQFVPVNLVIQNTSPAAAAQARI